MADVINGVMLPFLPIGGVEGLQQRPPIDVPEDKSFEEILQKELHELKFSQHAQQRLEARDIKLTDAQIEQLQSAVAKADAKGARESLVLLQNIAFIVNVKNRTVVTAIDSEHLQQNVFTNIDSAIIAS
jgi:flagellar operon protein